MKPMRYKGYCAHIEYSDEDGCFVGHIAGIRHIVGFHGDSVQEMRTAFEEAVEDYLDHCKTSGISPQKPYSGKIMLRIAPELHEKAAIAAETRGISLNQFATDALSRALVS